MDVAATNHSSGYAKPPWLFQGSALYQLHLVKSETARAFIPKEFRLVEAFGYTLGGFFLAHYDDSPVGTFDELVVIAGIVWNPPRSCAWAARVLVNSREACIHGRKEVGLPSQMAEFSKNINTLSERRRKRNDFLNMMGVTSLCRPKDRMDIQVTEIEGSGSTNFCNINLPTSVPDPEFGDKWMGPALSMSLPSFSGGTEYCPQLLKYSCQIECSFIGVMSAARVRAVKPAKVSTTSPTWKNDKESSEDQHISHLDAKVKELAESDARDRSIAVLLSKPVLALEFNSLKMQVEAPTVIHPRAKTAGGF